MTTLVRTPSRICLFGEHQDYLGLEVIASAIDLTFQAKAAPNNSRRIVIRIRDSRIASLGEENSEQLYETVTVPLDEPIVYTSRRDYFKSAVAVLRKAGIEPVGCDIQMDSTIPIGKGMCSSTTMILAYLTALVSLAAPERAGQVDEMARLAWKAEVEEFQEPGGMMDHYASAYGGLCHMDFASGIEAHPLQTRLNGVFILIDSLQQKDTIRVLSNGKVPVLDALRQLEPYGIRSIRDFVQEPSSRKYLDKLDAFHRTKVEANIANYQIQREALQELSAPNPDDERIGYLLNEHQRHLRDGVGASTPLIDQLLELARQKGAYGGKFNGSGGGGCLFVYASARKAADILAAVHQAGYPAVQLHQAQGLRIWEETAGPVR